MRYFYILLSFALFMVALGFALKNAEPVTLHYYLGFAWRAPLVLVLLTTLCVGVLAGILACLPTDCAATPPPACYATRVERWRQST